MTVINTNTSSMIARDAIQRNKVVGFKKMQNSPS